MPGRFRRIVTTAAYGGGGLGVLGVTFYGLLVAEALYARRVIKPLGDGEAPPSDGVYSPTRGRGSRGGRESAEPLKLAMLGDSIAAGYGANTAYETPGVVLARGLAARTGRRVRLMCPAMVGAESGHLAPQIDKVMADGPPDVAVIVIGGNDVTHRIPRATAIRHLGEAVDRLVEAGCPTVVGTCPDLGTVEPLRQPLRWVARLESRRLAAAQTITAVAVGARTVSLGDLLGPEFAAAPKRMFAADRFHPSAFGYRSAAHVLLPSITAAMGYPEPDSPVSIGADAQILPLPVAATEAAAEAGTEVAGTATGRAGRWAYEPRMIWTRVRHRVGTQVRHRARQLPRWASTVVAKAEARSAADEPTPKLA